MCANKVSTLHAIYFYSLFIIYHGVQATIAEIIGSEEAMDLFRHTTELGSHVRNHVINLAAFILHSRKLTSSRLICCPFCALQYLPNVGNRTLDEVVGC